MSTRATSSSRAPGNSATCVLDSWPEIARRTRRYSFASKKTLAHPECQACQYQSICHGGCPKLRHGPHGRFEDLDYFCQAYKTIYARSVEPLRAELRKLRIGEPAGLDRR